VWMDTPVGERLCFYRGISRENRPGKDELAPFGVGIRQANTKEPVSSPATRPQDLSKQGEPMSRVSSMKAMLKGEDGAAQMVNLPRVPKARRVAKRKEQKQARKRNR